MHTPIKTIMLAGLLSTTLGAYAQTAPTPAADPTRSATEKHAVGHHHRQGHELSERRTQHLAKLKSELALEPQQEAAWQTFATTFDAPPARPMVSRDEMAKLSTPERLDKLQVLRQQREARMDQIAAATRDLYKQLKPEQQAKFDESTRRIWRRMRS